MVKNYILIYKLAWSIESPSWSWRWCVLQLWHTKLTLMVTTRIWSSHQEGWGKGTQYPHICTWFVERLCIDFLSFTSAWEKLSFPNWVLWVKELAYSSLQMIFHTESNAKKVEKILQTFENEAGQKLNKDKSILMFSKGTDSHSKNLVSHILGIQKISTHAQYLGATLTMDSNDHHDI